MLVPFLFLSCVPPPHVLLQDDQGVHSENLVTAGCDDTATAAAAAADADAMTGLGQGLVLQDLDC